MSRFSLPVSVLGLCLAPALALVLLSSSAHARVFNFDQRTVATYLRGTYGSANLQNNGFIGGMPASETFPSSSVVTTGYSAEIGLAYTSPKSFTFRLGVELLSPNNLTAIQGVNSSGAVLMSVDSQVYSVIPQVNIESFLKNTPMSRWYLGAGVGYAVTTLKNTVTMTSAGTAATGLNNYIEEGTGWGIMGQGYLGYEFSFFDNVGLSFEGGYRYLMVNNYTANRNYQNATGQVNTGNPVLNVGGTKRSTDLSGFFAGLSFRIYFD